jgi:hypothetical protein
MVKRDDAELDQLLARGRLSGRQYDEIAGRVMKQLAPRRQRWLWPAVVPAAAGVALGAWLLVSGNVLQRPGGRAPAGSAAADGFRSKGDLPSAPASEESALAVAFDVGCARAARRVCRLGDTLMFSVPAGAASGYLGAYAERLDEPGARRIWYFPDSSGGSPRIDAASVTRVLTDGVRLGPPHLPGKYRITLWVSPTPVLRTEADMARGERAQVSFEIVD